MKLSQQVLNRRVFNRSVNDGLIASTIMGQLGPLIPKDRICVDVGAATGHFTDYFAPRCKFVHAFEAVPAVYMQLMKKETEFPNVKAYNLAVSDFQGKRTFYVDDKRLSNSSFQDLVGGPSFEAMVTCLDRQFTADAKIGFIKVDVEGTELDVLAGAVEILERDRPNLLVEIYKPYTAFPIDMIFDYLMVGHGYDCYYFDKGKLIPVYSVEEGEAAVENKHSAHDGDFLFTDGTMNGA